MSKFGSNVFRENNVDVVKLSGVIDEDNELNDIVDKIPPGVIYIDLGEIERINSCGVRDWVNWLARLEKNGSRGVLVECSPAIVAQINLVNNFTGNGAVKSFYVPYYCSECDEEKVLLVEAADMGQPPHEPPKCRCDECDLPMDFDDMPDSYFAFLSNQKKISDASMGPTPRAAGSGAPGKVKTRGSQPVVPTGGAVQAMANHGTGPLGAPITSPAPRSSVPSLHPNLRSGPTGAPQTMTPVPGSLMKGQSQPPSRAPQLTHAKRPSQMPGRVSSHSLSFQAQGSQAPAVAPPRGNAIVFVLLGVLVIAIGLFVYLLVSRP